MKRISTFKNLKALARGLTQPPVLLSTIDVTPANPTTKDLVGTTLQFTATGHYNDGSTADLTASVTWGTTDGTKININPATGLATMVAAGVVLITATLGAITGFSVAIFISLDSISIAPLVPTVKDVVGTTEAFTATGHYSDASTIDLTTLASWTSGTPGTATIGLHTGVATMVLAGTTTIQASYASLAPASTLLTFASFDSLVVTPASPTLFVGSDRQMTATAHFSDASTADYTGAPTTWNSSDLTKATITSPGGLATGVAPGPTTLTATRSGISGNTVATVSSQLSILSDNAQTVAHFFAHGGTWQDTKGNLWVQNGAPTFNPAGALGFPAGPATAEFITGFGDGTGGSGTNWFELGTGPDVLDLASDFILTVIGAGNGAPSAGVIYADTNGAAGQFMSGDAGFGTVVFGNPLAGQALSLTGSPWILSWGYNSGTGHWWYKFNGNAPVDAGALGPPTIAPLDKAFIGRYVSAGGQYWPSAFYELRATTDAASAAALNAIHAEVGL